MPPLAPIITTPFLSSLRATPYLPRQTWYFITTVTLSIINRPDEICNAFGPALQSASASSGDGDGAGQEKGKEKEEDGLTVARKTRDALIKSIPIGGLPKAINALYALKRVTPPSLLDDPLSYDAHVKSASHSSTSSIDRRHTTDSILSRGQSLFDRIYGKVSTRVMSQMDRCGTPDLGLSARWMYGGILSGGHTIHNVLSPAEVSFVLIAGLIPQDVNPQLKGHLKGALNNGATKEEARAVRQVVIRICEQAGMRCLSGHESHRDPENAGAGIIAPSSDKRGEWGWTENIADL